MGRQRDPFWDYAENVNGRFKCNYCGRDFPGGASRIKAHLAGVPGHDIVACNAVPQDVQKKAQATQKKREAQVTQGTNKKLKSVPTSASKSKTKVIKIVTQVFSSPNSIHKCLLLTVPILFKINITTYWRLHTTLHTHFLH